MLAQIIFTGRTKIREAISIVVLRSSWPVTTLCRGLNRMSARASAQSGNLIEIDREHWMVPFSAALSIAVVMWRMSAAWRISDELGHGWAVACFVSWWLWDRWNTRPAPQPCSISRWIYVSWALLILPLVAWSRIVLTPFPFWSAALWVFTAGMCSLLALGLWATGGRPWVVHFGFAAVLLATALPWPGVVTRSLVAPMRVVLAQTAGEVLNFAGIPTITDGTMLRVGLRWLSIDEACAGLRSLHLMIAAAIFAGSAVRLPSLRRFALVGVGVILAITGNFLRILFLAWLVAQGSDAGGRWHDLSGYIALALMLAVIVFLTWKWQSTTSTIPKMAIQTRFAARWWWVNVAIFCLALEAATWLWYARGDQGWQPAWKVQMPVGDSSYTMATLSLEAKSMLQTDYYSAGSWRGADGVERTAFYLEWRRGSKALAVSSMHNPTICFPSAGFELTGSLGTIDINIAGVKLPFFGYIFRRRGETVVACYTIWDADLGAPLMENYAAGLTSRWDIVAAGRAQIRGQMLTLAWTGGGSDLATVRARLAGDASLLIKQQFGLPIFPRGASD
jgi:exosortase